MSHGIYVCVNWVVYQSKYVSAMRQAPLLGYVFVFTTSLGYPSLVYCVVVAAW